MVSVIIPVRAGGDPYVTLRSLKAQDFPLEVCIGQDVDGRGANWARNHAVKMARTEYLLFSDDDIQWRPGAVRLLYETLVATPAASYAYGAWRLVGGPRDGFVQCDREFNGPALERGNYISTMSLVRRQAFLRFDEDLHRLQDWELWLRMWLGSKAAGVYCGQIIFDSAEREGITTTGQVAWQAARDYIVAKHNLQRKPGIR